MTDPQQHIHNWCANFQCLLLEAYVICDRGEHDSKHNWCANFQRLLPEAYAICDRGEHDSKHNLWMCRCGGS